MRDDRQFSPRVRVHTMAALIDHKGKRVDCVLIDLSVDGFRAELAMPHDPKSFVKLDTGSSVYSVEVRWATGLELGGRVLERV